MVPEGAAAEDPHPAPVGAGGAAPRRPGPHRALTATQAGAAIPPVRGVRASTGFSTFSFLAEPPQDAETNSPATMFDLAFGLLLAPGRDRSAAPRVGKERCCTSPYRWVAVH